jgi:hypothetical protein
MTKGIEMQQGKQGKELGEGMNTQEPLVIEGDSLRCLLSLPEKVNERHDWPMLCFLHGYEEGAPTDLHKALTRHGPLRKGSSSAVSREFIVISPQLPRQGDIWYQYGEEVLGIVEKIRNIYHSDPVRTYLTGFSFGGNGVFDLALVQGGYWAALWPVDPTRVPDGDPGCPVWLSFGEVSRRFKKGFIRELGLEPVRAQPEGDRVYLDQGRDHVGTAASAYSDDRIYAWLKSKKNIA